MMTKVMKRVPLLGFLSMPLMLSGQVQLKALQFLRIKRDALYSKVLLVILAMMSFAHYSVAQNWDQIIKTAASDRAWRYQSDREVNDYFGASVAIDGNYAIVGAYLEEQFVTNPVPFQHGSAFLFKKNSSGQWVFLKKLKAADLAANDNFGYSVAINGNTIVIGAWNENDVVLGPGEFGAGAVYVFSKDQGGPDNWGQVKKIVASDRTAGDQFGTSVSISGSYIVVGAPKEAEDASGGATAEEAGSAYVFYKDQGGTDNWGQVKKIVAADRSSGDLFGRIVSISGANIVVGAWGQDMDAAGANSLQQAGAAFVFSKDAGGTDNWGQVKKLVASDRAADDYFGYGVAISGNNIVVGAYTEGHDAVGGATLLSAGSAYVFNKDHGGIDNWGQIKKLVNSDREAADLFGCSVAINGNTIVVGAYNEDHDAAGGANLFAAGSAYIFNKDQGGADNWGQTKKIVASDRAANDNFGWSVSISGSDIISGAWAEDEDDAGLNTLSAAGAAYTFNLDQGGAANWGQVNKLVAKSLLGNIYYGGSVSIDGDYAVIGASGEDKDAAGLNSKLNAGAVYVLKKQAGVWTELKKLVASDRAADDYFGRRVAISGNYIIVGAHTEDEDAAGGNTLSAAGAAYVFSKDQGGTDNWGQVKKLVASDRATLDNFGMSVSISGNLIVVGASNEDEDAAGGATLSAAGSAYVFSKDEGGTDNWGQVKKLVAADRGASDNFGSSISISGNNIVVGAYNEDEDAAGGATLLSAGSAYVFNKDQGGTDNWGQVKKLVATDRAASDYFGFSIAISGNNIVVGAVLEDEDAAGGAGLTSAGSAYLFNKDQGGTDNWGQVKKLVTSDRAAGDYFGWSIAISGNNIVVGAYNESEDAAGGATLTNAGSAYVFGKDQGGANNWGQVQKIVASDRAASDGFGEWVAISGSTILVGASQEDEDADGITTITSAGSVYFFANASVLPLTWGSFTAEKQQNKVLLSWTTLQEQNTRYFTIQHSIDGSNWRAIGDVNAARTSSSIRQYAFTHTLPVAGKNFYRLLQTDLDSKTAYSQVRLMNWTAAEKLMLYANPVINGVMQLQIPTAGELQIFSASGQLLLSKKIASGRQTVDVHQLSAGCYLVRCGDKTSQLIIQ